MVISRNERFSINPQLDIPTPNINFIPNVGIIMVSTHLPSNFPTLGEFKNNLLKTKPWNSIGKPNGFSARGAMKAEVDGVSIWVKKSIWTIDDIDSQRNNSAEFENRVSNSDPLRLFQKYETATRRFREAYPDDNVVLEQPIAAFVDDSSGEIYIMYADYPHKSYTNQDLPYVNGELERRGIDRESLRDKFRKIGIVFHDDLQTIITHDEQDEWKLQVVIIDLEDMEVLN